MLWLYDAMLYVNAIIAVANTVIYLLAARRTSRQFRLFKYMIALTMFSTVLVYVELATPQAVFVPLGSEGLLVRLNYSGLLLVLMISGLVGMVGSRGSKNCD
jgi:hypothetical protein